MLGRVLHRHRGQFQPVDPLVEGLHDFGADRPEADYRDALVAIRSCHFSSLSLSPSRGSRFRPHPAPIKPENRRRQPGLSMLPVYRLLDVGAAHARSDRKFSAGFLELVPGLVTIFGFPIAVVTGL